MRYCVLLAAALLILAACGANGNYEEGMRVFYFDAAAGEMSYSVAPQPREGRIVHEVLGHLQHMDEWPEAELLGVVFADGVFTMAFCRLYLEQSPLEEALFRAAATLTLVDLPLVSEVEIRVLAEDFHVLETFIESAVTISNNPQIGAIRLATEQFVLFTIDESGEALASHQREAVDIEHHNRNRILVEMLVEDNPAIPAETRVRDVIIDSTTGVIYVDLSGDFVARFSGSAAHARLMLSSIVHTMIENTPGPRTRRVLILIDSERREDFHGVGDFHLGFTLDEEL